ncbi:Hypothetical protein CINCED_3A000929 [Cinara cedri]|uniref:Reverse transcriptase domain n=1 Tax=Cinara cedri TaxID=506608 RepID=A0A5E4MEP8_9HEMI|nr:Hypothetical protein CINCED_3A000929 [Cinara cedri]
MICPVIPVSASQSLKFVYENCLRGRKQKKKKKEKKDIECPNVLWILNMEQVKVPERAAPVLTLDISLRCGRWRIGKLFERIIKRRLEAHLESVGGLSERQYGFRKVRHYYKGLGNCNASSRWTGKSKEALRGRGSRRSQFNSASLTFSLREPTWLGLVGHAPVSQC